MSEPTRTLADRFSLADGIVGGVVLIVTALVIALGFDFGVGETLEVLVAGVALVGVMGIAAGIPWAVGRLVELLTEDA